MKPLTAEECKVRAMVNHMCAEYVESLVAFNVVDRAAGLHVHRALTRRATKWMRLSVRRAATAQGDVCANEGHHMGKKKAPVMPEKAPKKKYK